MGSESAPVVEILRDPSQLADNPSCGFRSSGLMDHDCNSHTERLYLRRGLGARCDNTCRCFCSDKKARRRPIVGRSRRAICRIQPDNDVGLRRGRRPHFWQQQHADFNGRLHAARYGRLEQHDRRSTCERCEHRIRRLEQRHHVDITRWQRTGGSAPGFWQYSHCWALGQESDLPVLHRRGDVFGSG